VNIRADISGFTDCAVFPYLVMAANPHLSAREIQDVLQSFGERQWRSETWIRTRRWMCKPADTTPLQPSADGLDERARRIMRDNPRMSSRKLGKLLGSSGIMRPVEWVYRSRFD
jgi:predicted aconitase